MKYHPLHPHLMKGGSAGPWTTQKVNQLLNPLLPITPTLGEFAGELDSMFADLNREAMACQKLSTLRQGNSTVEDLIHQFEIHGPPSRLGNVGLVDWFESAIHPRLQESIYRLQPMLSTWAEWKSKASLLDNQWQQFQATQCRPLLQKIAPLHRPP